GPNPEGFTRTGEIHAWFESTLVARVEPAEVRAAPEAARALGDVADAVQALLADSLAQVPRLYRLERESRRTGDDAGARELVRERLAARGGGCAGLPWGSASCSPRSGCGRSASCAGARQPTVTRQGALRRARPTSKRASRRSSATWRPDAESSARRGRRRRARRRRCAT